MVDQYNNYSVDGGERGQIQVNHVIKREERLPESK